MLENVPQLRCWSQVFVVFDCTDVVKDKAAEVGVGVDKEDQTHDQTGSPAQN